MEELKKIIIQADLDYANQAKDGSGDWDRTRACYLNDKAIEGLAKAIEQYVIKARIKDLDNVELKGLSYLRKLKAGLKKGVK